jgi:dipeptidyl-peptidase III
MQKLLFVTACALLIHMGCKSKTENSKTETTPEVTENFQWIADTFADVQVIRYQVPGFEKLSLQQKKYVYYLSQAALSGRDIFWDQNYRHNISIRKALENILENHKGDKTSVEWKSFEVYAKRVFFSNGIHHHYSNDKFIPKFSEKYLRAILTENNVVLTDEIIKAIMDPNIDSKKVNLDPSKDLISASAVNFYSKGLTEKEVDAFYKPMINPNDPKPLAIGINSTVVKNNDGKISEDVWKSGGKYGKAIDEICKWLTLASEVSENDQQKNATLKLIEYYKTGSLKAWDEYNILWVKATEGDIDYINGFIEVYDDPKGIKASYESAVQIKDFDASARMKVLGENAQWFEDQSPILPQHKKKNVVGVSYKVVNVATESGALNPATAIGINLPNSLWIRKDHGSKSVSLGNIVQGYEMASGPGLLQEFCATKEELDRSSKHSKLAGKMHTALHEVLGHASGQLEKGVGNPSETLKNYASCLEEARADLVGLYYIIDPKLTELKLAEGDELGKAQYDSYFRNGLMLQLRRIEPGKTIEESHMRNRQLICNWVMEKGAKDKVVEYYKKDNKTFIRVNDYSKTRVLFGELLKEIQRVISQGDYKAGRELVENYGVKVNKEIHKEVLSRSEKLNIPPYGGFVNPRIVAKKDEKGNITDVTIEYAKGFLEEMLYYGKNYSF